MKNRLLYILVLFIGGLTSSPAQEASLKLHADTNTIRIGEQLRISLEGNVPAESKFQWPRMPDTISRLVLVSESNIDTSVQNDRWKIVQSFTITSFDSGQVNIPALTLAHSGQKSRSAPISLAVLMPEVDDEQDYFDIKKTLEVSRGVWEVLRWILLALGILGVIALAFWWWRRRQKGATESVDPGLPPFEKAQGQLAQLESKELWQNGQIKEYYSELIDILREYLEGQFAIKAMESTAGELVEKVKDIHESPEQERQMREILLTSAMVKYAREKPGAAMNEKALSEIRTFVERTRTREEDPDEDDQLPVSES